MNGIPSFKKSALVMILATFCGSTTMCVLLAQQPHGAGNTAKPRKALSEPGQEGQLLSARVGRWALTETVWATPNAAPVVTTGLVADRRMIGNLLQETLRDPSAASGQSIKRTDLLTYNRLEGRWDYVSFDARAPVGLMSAWSLDQGEGSTISVRFAPFAMVAFGDATTGQLLRMDETITFEDLNRDVKDQFFTLADGTGKRWLAHRYAYVRRP